MGCFYFSANFFTGYSISKNIFLLPTSPDINTSLIQKGANNPSGKKLLIISLSKMSISDKFSFSPH